MALEDPELLVGAITAVGLLLLPLASRLVAVMGREISRELDGGTTGESLTEHLDRRYASRSGGELAMREAEIRQLREALAFVRRNRGKPGPDADSD